MPISGRVAECTPLPLPLVLKITMVFRGRESEGLQFMDEQYGDLCDRDPLIM